MASKYDDLASAFGSTFEPEEEEGSTQLVVRSVDEVAEGLKAKQELMTTTNDTIEDQTYIQQELRIGVELLGDVAETLRVGINQGSKASSFDAFANLMKERREHIKELKDTNLELRKLKNPENTPNSPATGSFTQNNLVMTGTDALDMIRNIMNGPIKTAQFEEE